MRRINLGIIGTGQIITDAYLPILPFLCSIQSTLLYDINPAASVRTVEIFKKWIEEGVFDRDYNEFQEPREKAERFIKSVIPVRNISEVLNFSDFVLITTPPNTHIPLALKVIEKGNIPIIEKPLSTKSLEFLSLTSKQQKNLLENSRYQENFIFNPAYQELKKRIDSEEIGEVILIETCLANIGPSPSKDSIWRLNKHISGGGALYDWGPHTIGLSLFLGGIERNIEKSITHHIEYSTIGEKIAEQEINLPLDLESLISITLEPKNRIPTTLLIENSWKNSPDQESPKGKSWIRVEGTIGTYHLELRKIGGSKEYHLTYTRRRSEEETTILPVRFPHDSFYYALKTQIEGEIPEYCKFNFGLKVLDLIEKSLIQ